MKRSEKQRLEQLYLDSYNLEKNINDPHNDWDASSLKRAKDNLEHIDAEIKELRKK